MFVYLFLALIALVLSPKLWTLGRAVVYVARRLSAFYAPSLAKKARAYIRNALYVVAGYFVLQMVLMGTAIFAFKGGHERIFGFIMFLSALSVWPIQKKLVFLANLSQAFLPKPLHLREPKITSLMIVVPINAGITAMLFPHWFYNGFGTALLIVLMAGTVWMVAFATESALAAKAFAVMTIITIASWIVLWLVPAHIEAATNYFKKSELNRGKNNLVEQLNMRPDRLIKDDVLGWTVVTYENGDPVLDSNNFAKVKPCMVNGENGPVQMVYKKDSKFRTLDVRVSVDAGEPLIQIYTPNADGTWIVSENSLMCWIPVSKTEFAGAPKAEPTPEAKPVANTATDIPKELKTAPEKKTSEVSKFYVPGNDVIHTDIYVKKGQSVKIIASGKVNSLPDENRNDGTYRWVGPEGWVGYGPGFIAANRGKMTGPLHPSKPYLGLATRISIHNPSIQDGSWIYVGSRSTFVADEDGYLHFMVNEKITDQFGKEHMDWLQNNQGGFNLEVRIL